MPTRQRRLRLSRMKKTRPSTRSRTLSTTSTSSTPLTDLRARSNAPVPSARTQLSPTALASATFALVARQVFTLASAPMAAVAPAAQAPMKRLKTGPGTCVASATPLMRLSRAQHGCAKTSAPLPVQSLITTATTTGLLASGGAHVSRSKSFLPRQATPPTTLPAPTTTLHPMESAPTTTLTRTAQLTAPTPAPAPATSAHHPLVLLLAPGAAPPSRP